MTSYTAASFVVTSTRVRENQKADETDGLIYGDVQPSGYGGKRCLTGSGSIRINNDDMIIEKTTSPKEKPDAKNLIFGKHMSDHMLNVNWNIKTGWDKPKITPHGPLNLTPSASVFHYGGEIYEGLKAYKGEDGKVRLFRPDKNVERFLRSAKRMCLPEFNTDDLLQSIYKLVEFEKDWVPDSRECSLYIRPSLISTEPSLGVRTPNNAMLFVITCPVGPYFQSGLFNPVSLLADPQYIRSWPGGVGDIKAGGNYGSTVYVQNQAEAKGCSQVLWLFEDEITEVGTMNFFMFWINEHGEKELITPPLNGLILGGITRLSLLEMAREWGEFKVSEKSFTIHDVLKAQKEDRVIEIFGSGTACVVCPVDKILYEDKFYAIPTMDTGAVLSKRFLKELADIQYGRNPHPWAHVIC